MKRLLLTLIVTFIMAIPAHAQHILYIPADNRPVSLEDVTATVRAAGLSVETPPPEFIGDRTSPGDPDLLWDWLLSRAGEADAVVMSADSLLYGSLVASRGHYFAEDVLTQRLDNFATLKAQNPSLRLYVFSTIMRTPQASSGGVEPPYYEVYGPAIFRITALQDKQDITGLTRGEKSELDRLLAYVPQAAQADWFARRSKNYNANLRLIAHLRQGAIDYLIQGRDDCSPLSQSHKESRLLSAVAGDLPASKYISFPGADQLGMLLVTRAINDASFKTPIVRVVYSPGKGAQTIPSYEDVPTGQTITGHIYAAGGIPLPTAAPDLVLAVNTPENGHTFEANSPANRTATRKSSARFAAEIGRFVAAGNRVAVADIAFGNGADNAFMHSLSRQRLFFRLASYSGWNTASNTLGFAIGQGMLADAMTDSDKNRLIAVRLLDDWAYQANIRGAVAAEVLYPAGGSYVKLDELTPRLVTETDRRLRSFAAAHFPEYPLDRLKISFPWNRMFEVKVELE